MTEGRGTGIPRVLHAAKANGSPEPVFHTDPERTFFLVEFPLHPAFLREETASAEERARWQVAEQVTEQVERLLKTLSESPCGTREIMASLQIRHRPTFLYDYLRPALQLQMIEMTQPKSPRSPGQRYRLTDRGRLLLRT